MEFFSDHFLSHSFLLLLLLSFLSLFFPSLFVNFGSVIFGIFTPAVTSSISVLLGIIITPQSRRHGTREPRVSIENLLLLKDLV